MGKKWIEKMQKLADPQTLKVSLCKRKKGLLKKMIELSLLCDLKIFAFIYNTDLQKVTHYASNEAFDLRQVFTHPCTREFYSNDDYGKVGGCLEDLDDELRAKILSLGN